MTKFEFTAIDTAVKKIMKENYFSDIHAIRKMKETALKFGNTRIAECVEEYQNILIDKGIIDPILVS